MPHFLPLDNHFHLLLEVPQAPAEAWDDARLLAHLEVIGFGGENKALLGDLVWRLEHYRSIGADAQADALRQSYLRRMWDVSFFMKALKQQFTQWFNTLHNRKGTLWEERFKSVLVEGSWEAIATVGAYIDLNPLRAGIVADPKDYRWCGYAEAVAGEKPAMQGMERLAHLIVRGHLPGSQEKGAAPLEIYRQIVFCGAESRGIGEDGRAIRRGVPRERIEAVLAKQGKLSREELLLCRVRHFCDGAILGSRAFVNEQFHAQRWRFGPKRKDGARPLRFVEDNRLYALRDLRLRTLGSG